MVLLLQRRCVLLVDQIVHVGDDVGEQKMLDFVKSSLSRALEDQLTVLLQREYPLTRLLVLPHQSDLVLYLLIRRIQCCHFGVVNLTSANQK